MFTNGMRETVTVLELRGGEKIKQCIFLSGNKKNNNGLPFDSKTEIITIE